MGPRGRSPELEVEPSLERPQRLEPPIERGVDQPETDERKQHVEGGPEVENHMGAEFILPDGGNLPDREPSHGQRIEKVNVKGQIGEFKSAINSLNCGPFGHFGSTLGIRNAHVKEGFYEQVEKATSKPAFAGLDVGDPGVRQPTRTDNAVGTGTDGFLDKVQEGVGRRRSVGIDIADQFSPRGEAKALDQGTTLAYGFPELEMGDEWISALGIEDDG